MATSNFSGFDEASNSWFWNGNKTTADRYRYELSRQQETTLKQVNDLITREAAQVVAPAAGFSQQEYGGFLRQVVPTLLDQYGKINATAAIQFYDQSRDYWTRVLSDASQGGRDARRSAATRFATARTRSSLAVAQGYAAQFADTYDTISKTDTVVNFAMKVRAKSGHAPSVEAMNNALTREVASYHRDTVLFNSALDPYVQRVQRVAQATACEFCRLMALGSTTGKVRVSTYAAKFHSHCHCTIQPLFDGEQPIRPDYYDKFEKEYAEASKSGGSAKDILKNWRENSKTASVAVKPVEVPRVVSPAKPAVIKTADEFEARSRDVSMWDVPVTADIPDQYWWQKLDGKGIKVFDIRNAQQIPLDKSGVSVPKLKAPNSIEVAAKSANPNYDKGSGYKTNCARAIQAYELRRRGFDVTANENTNDFLQSMRTYLSGWRDPKTGVTAYEATINVANSRKAIETIKSFPEGARGAISFDYSGRRGAGHTLNWEVKNGEVLYVDAQPGFVGPEVVKALAGQKLKNFQVTRLDNLEPTAHVLGYIEGFGK